MGVRINLFDRGGDSERRCYQQSPAAAAVRGGGHGAPAPGGGGAPPPPARGGPQPAGPPGRVPCPRVQAAHHPVRGPEGAQDDQNRPSVVPKSDRASELQPYRNWYLSLKKQSLETTFRFFDSILCHITCSFFQGRTFNCQKGTL